MLNKQGPGKIDWTDYTWNPIKGCLHDCEYCYMRRMEKRFGEIMDVGFRPHYFGDLWKIKRSSYVFVGSSGDMWGDWVPRAWIRAVLAVVDQYRQHIFQFLTKNPSRYSEFGKILTNMPHCWIGTTDDGTERTAGNIDILRKTETSSVKFVSFEPLLVEVDPDLTGLDWVIVGANSNRGAEKPPKVWADKIISQARAAKAGVWIKDNYHYPDVIKEVI